MQNFGRNKYCTAAQFCISYESRRIIGSLSTVCRLFIYDLQAVDWIWHIWLQRFSIHCLFSRLVAVNKMVCHFWHQFLTQFSLLFQMVPFFFLSMAAVRPTNTKLSDWLLELFQPIRLWLSELPYRAKWMAPSERALKTKSETAVKSFTLLCWGSSLWKTNSE